MGYAHSKKYHIFLLPLFEYLEHLIIYYDAKICINEI